MCYSLKGSWRQNAKESDKREPAQQGQTQLKQPDQTAAQKPAAVQPKVDRKELVDA